MNDALGVATAGFREATGELQTMGAEIKRELEMTRAELKRGIVELPHETQETAANMRRVVADQIKALNELAALVSRSNRAVDVLPAMAQPRRVGETVAMASVDALPRHAEPAAVAPVQEAAEPRASLARTASQTATPERPGRREEARSEEQARRETPAPHQTRAARDPIIPEQDVVGSDSDGWKSNPARASQDDHAKPSAAAAAPSGAEPERPRANTLESLDTISVDIARMIDHEAAVELWDRYRPGEQNVFTRRLYTPQGQQTFDEIRRKYRRDPEFRQTVDRYVEEFERLIAQVSREDRDPALARTYLTSETGKVYTMLAHAGGRFD
jgi:hypothetical protein